MGPFERGETSGDLTRALQNSLDLLDPGNSRYRAQPYSLNQADRTATPDTADDVFTAEDLKTTQERCDQHFETFMAQDKRSNELRDKDLSSEEDQQRVREGKYCLKFRN